MLTRILATALASAAGSVAMGQTLWWTQRVSDVSSFHNAEVALGVNRLGTDVMVAWIHFYYDPMSYIDYDIWYNVSVNGETFGQAARIPRDTQHEFGTLDGSDPMVAFSRYCQELWMTA